jgi:HPr kinase/phosphorylase
MIAGAAGLERRISEAAINRPGLAISGFFQYFAHRRVQVLGLAEQVYLASLTPAERHRRLRHFYERRVPCVVVSRGRKVMPELTRLADEFKVPLLRTPMVTMDFVNAATITMVNLMAPRMNVQGTMVEIMGIGVLIEGKPGMGKSEAALGLIKRGHALVSDDITALRVDSANRLIASPVSVTRYHMEIRGVGIIHVPSLFGVAAIRSEKVLDLVATLAGPGEADSEDRGDRPENVRSFLGLDIPQIVVRVAAGRDLANVIEAAALNFKLKRLGHDAAKELDEKLIGRMTSGGAGGE